MYNLDDTIVAVSSSGVRFDNIGRSILRVSGPETYSVLNQLVVQDAQFERNSICDVTFSIAGTTGPLAVPAKVYSFYGPSSYTGQDLAELHVLAGEPVIEKLMELLLTRYRQAKPGEFTFRAYINGKIDLSQAEAVGEIVSAGNRTQLAAAEKLLEGRLCQTLRQIRQETLDVLSKLEAGLDFSEEVIEFISQEKALDKIDRLKQLLEDVLNGCVHYERMIDLPSVGLVGLPNAGKSSLHNALLGHQRSIVSHTKATTRDVLADMLTLQKLDCVLFDCAGLFAQTENLSVLDSLAQRAAIEAIRTSSLVIFCVDINKTDVTHEQTILNTIAPSNILFAATKADTVWPQERKTAVANLEKTFSQPFIITSADTGENIDTLKGVIERRLLKLRAGNTETDERIGINQRHRQILQSAIDQLNHCMDELGQGDDEIAAMSLREGYRTLGAMEHEDVSESILDNIFSRFCIGK